MDINDENLEFLKKNIMSTFNGGMAKATIEDLMFLYSEVPSTTRSNFYNFLKNTPRFRKWVGERVFKALEQGKYELVNEDFELSLAIDDNDLKDDQFGGFMLAIGQASGDWPRLKVRLVMDVLLNNPICWTGKAFIADDHDYGGGTIDNKSTSNLSVAAFEAAFTAAAAYVDNEGNPLEVNYTHLIIGPKNRTTAFNIVQAQNVQSGGAALDNPNYNRVEVVESKKLVGAHEDKWYLVDATGSLPPVILQIREEVSSDFDTDSKEVRRNKKAEFMANGRLVAGPTFPHLVYGGGQS